MSIDSNEGAWAVNRIKSLKLRSTFLVKHNNSDYKLIAKNIIIIVCIRLSAQERCHDVIIFSKSLKKMLVSKPASASLSNLRIVHTILDVFENVFHKSVYHASLIHHVRAIHLIQRLF